MAWNREHAGVAAAPAVAIDWSVTAMTEAAGRLAVAGAWDLPRAAAAVGETVWWVTLVDATLVRYHLRDYERALASKAVRRRKTEETLEGLRCVRNQLGRSVDRSLSLSDSEHRPAGGRERSSAAWSGGRPRRPVAVFRHRAVAAAKPSGNPPSLARVRRGALRG